MSNRLDRIEAFEIFHSPDGVSTAPTYRKPKLPRWSMAMAVIVAGGLLVSACNSTPTVPHTESAAPIASPAQLGKRYRSDLTTSIQEFLGNRYLERGFSFSDNNLSADELWVKSFDLERYTVSEFIETGKAGSQRFLVSNRYDGYGEYDELAQMVGTRISPYMANTHGIQINLNLLPGEPLPTLSPNIPLGPIPFERLKETAEDLYNLPDNLNWREIEVCYHGAMDPTDRYTRGLVASGVLRDGRYLLLQIDETGDADLRVNAPQMGIPLPSNGCRA